jgi:hypothetical protein
VYTIHNGLRNPKRAVTPFATRISVSNHQDSGFLLEEFTNLVRTEIPHRSDFSHGVMAFGVSYIFELC